MNIREYTGEYVKITITKGIGSSKRVMSYVGKIDKISRFTFMIVDRPRQYSNVTLPRQIYIRDIKVLTDRDKNRYYNDSC